MNLRLHFSVTIKTYLFRSVCCDSLRTLSLISIIILLFGFSSLAISGGSQSITLHVKNELLENVIKEIERQTNYGFLYVEGQLKNAKRVNMDVKEEKIEIVLDILFRNQPLSFTIQNRVVILKEKPNVKVSLTSSAPKDTNDIVSVRGVVLNERDEPLPGVSVSVKNSKIFTLTNLSGEFVLNKIEENAILIFSHVTMETIELVLDGRTDFQVKLKTKFGDLSDVTVTVSTGYEDIPKERSTGSFVKISNNTLNQQVGTNILKRLDGVTSGILFDNNKVINGVPKREIIAVRGLSTINASTDPLIVLDGFIYEGTIDNINPNDVESITILKDAAATSIWGARASNGVIIIDTKRGQFDQKTRIGANVNLLLRSKPDLYDLPQMSSGEYIDVEQMLFNSGFFDDQINFLPYKALSPAVEVFLNRRAGLISAEDSASVINAYKKIDVRDQYDKYVYSNALTQQYSVNARGGSNNHAYFFSIAHDRNVDELDNRYRKLNVKFENTFKLTKNLTTSLSVYYTNSKGISGKQGYGELTIGDRRIPYFRMVDENGSPVAVANFYRNEFIETAGYGLLMDWSYYPLEDYKYSNSIVGLSEIFSNISIRYKMNRFLNLDVRYQYQKQQSKFEQINSEESFFTRNTINLFSQVTDPSSPVTLIVPRGGIRQLNNASIESHTIRGQLNFNHYWKSHSLSAILGQELRDVKKLSDNSTTYGYKEDPLSYTYVDFVNYYPTMLGTYEAIPANLSSSNVANRFVSFYGNAAYSFMQKYILSGSIRKDGSNIFGVNANDKWRPLWSVGLAWKISEEEFFRVPQLSYLKVRATYGYNGNVDLSKSALAVGSYLGPLAPTNFTAARINVINNPDLRWEKTGMLNFGLDFAFLKDIFSGSIEYYVKKSKDLYGPVPYDYTTSGYSGTVIKNVANMDSRGIDIILNSKIFDRAFKWKSGVLFNYISNKVTAYFSTNANDIALKFGDGTSLVPVIGKPLFGIAAFRWGGLDQSGNPRGFVNDKLSTNYDSIRSEALDKGLDGNVVYIGPASPTCFGSMINNFSWKNISLTINISYKLGYFVRKSSISYNSLVNNGQGHSDFSKRWQKPGDELITSIPAFVFPIVENREYFYNFSEANVLKADHVRLQYVNLSYTLPQRKANSSSRTFQIYLNLANLGILWRANDLNIDPDYPNSLRPSKSYAVGIRMEM